MMLRYNHQLRRYNSKDKVIEVNLRICRKNKNLVPN